MQKGLQSQKVLPLYIQQLTSKQKLGNLVEYYQEDLLASSLPLAFTAIVSIGIFTFILFNCVYSTLTRILPPIYISFIPVILFIFLIFLHFSRRRARVAACTDGLIQFTMNQKYQFCRWEDIETLYSNRFDGKINMRLLLKNGEEISIDSKLLRYSKKPISIGLADLVEQRFIALHFQDVLNQYWNGQWVEFGDLAISQQGIVNKTKSDSFIPWNIIKRIALQNTDSDDTNISLAIIRIDAGLLSGRLYFDVTPFPNFPLFMQLLTHSIKFPVDLDVKLKW